jgi:1-deoxy-D-xylulose-5-phosphate synthase
MDDEVLDLKERSLESLRELAEDLRQVIVNATLKNGGHLGASLGAVELAIALHREFESPREPIVWDVGHQAYAHKLLTGRWKRFDSLRTTGGLSGFLARAESEHDVFGAGHSSTALSAALAMAWARRQRQATASDWTVAVIGDGGLTAGLALEALNQVRSTQLAPLLLVLNDNQMSIAPNVGGIPAILAAGEARQFFDLLGLDYVGPVDGHDLGALLGTLRGLRAGPAPERPIVLHAITQKGKGYAPAEARPAYYHGISPVQAKVAGKENAPARRSYSEAFGQAMLARASRDPSCVAITAAMPEGTGLSEFARSRPERFFDVGIAEPHAVTFAAGLATQGYRPVVAIYSTFLQRALDGVIHDVALQALPVVFAIDRAGLVGADGPTHHGVFDLAFMGMVPGLQVLAPSCLQDVETLLSTALDRGGPVAIRYPRGSGEELLAEPLVDGLRRHQEAATPELIVVAYGAMAAKAAAACRRADPEASRVSCVSSVQVKPHPKPLMDLLVAHAGARVLVYEEGVVRGGAGESLMATCGGRAGGHELLGYPDRFAPHGSVADLEKAVGHDVASVEAKVRAALSAVLRA